MVTLNSLSITVKIFSKIEENNSIWAWNDMRVRK